MADDPGIIARLEHPTWGACGLVRVEGTDWIVRIVATGKLYRFPPSTRGHFTLASGSPGAPRPPVSPAAAPDPVRALAVVQHPELGLGDVLRVEIADWIVRYRSCGRTYKYPPAARIRLTVTEDFTPQKSFTRAAPAAAPPQPPGEAQPAAAKTSLPSAPSYPPLPPNARVIDVRPGVSNSGSRDAHESPTPGAEGRAAIPGQRARRVIESLRNGLPPVHAEARHLAVGIDRISRSIRDLLVDVDREGGRAMVIQGAYGQGKTFALKLMEEMALESGFAVVRTEIDATENRLNKPHHIYRDLMSHLRLPSVDGAGRVAVTALLGRTQDHLRSVIKGASTHYLQAWAALELLKKETACPPLAWLLSDPEVSNKQELVALLTCDPNVRVGDARRVHIIRGGSRDWPTFNAGTQGDFASFILSGVGRLCRMLGYRGLIVVMDEMEKWQDLNWREQFQAGNLLGGLIWGATAELGRRGRDDHPDAMMHSGRSGGYPFTTVDRSHLGVAIAMTPRGESSPEVLWRQYGILEMVQLPELTEAGLAEYCARLAPYYATAVGRASPNGQLSAIVRQAVSLWRRRGEFTTRSGIQAAIAAFDTWRDRTT